jgi:ferritin-like metal-binding protein YciE
MGQSSLRGFFISELKKSHDAEAQLIEALQLAVRASTTPELRDAFSNHLEQTKDHATRVQMMLDGLGEKPEGTTQGTKCLGIKSLVAEIEELQHGDLSSNVRDSALIAYAQRIEHYEIAVYGTLRDYASALGERETASQLQNILEEEQEADHQMTKIGQAINARIEREEANNQNPRELGSGHKPASRIKPAA